MAVRKNYFFSFMRQGIATLADPTAEVGKRMVLPVKVSLLATGKNGQTEHELVEKDVTLFGPGDILGIDERFISKTVPVSDANNFEAALTPFIEFSEPDLLWRFSTRVASDSQNWLPWMSLIILKVADGEEAGEFISLPATNPELPPQIQLESSAVLPDLSESWRWAHVYLQELENTPYSQISNTIKNSPGRVVCRLMSARRLKPETKYQAFLVPTYRIGMEAALGMKDGTEDCQLLSWDTPASGAGQVLPYYYQWEFRTGTKGDFEYLVRILKPRVLDDMGTRALNCGNPGYGITPEVTEMKMEGALKSLDTTFQAWGMDEANPPNATQKSLATLLNKREEVDENGNTILRVTPPVYGEWYSGKVKEALKLNPDNLQHWIEELNLDFRHRAAAGLGVQFVKINQETLMKAAWEQFTKVKNVNRSLNLGRFGRQVSTCLHKRLGRLNPDTFLRLSLPMHTRVACDQEGVSGSEAASQTISAVLNSSPVTNMLSHVTLKRFMPVNAAKVITKEAAKTGDGFRSFRTVFNNQVVSTGFQVQGLINNDPGSSKKAPQPEEVPDADYFTDLAEQTRAALDPKQTIQNKFAARCREYRKLEKSESTPAPAALDPLRPVIWYPEFHRPMYRFLRELSKEHILPGMESIPQNTIGLLQTNRRFIEAFMIGLNHEFASELRWREFPTDMRGSYFRSFWDTSIYSLDSMEKTQFHSTELGTALLQEIITKYGNNFDSFAKIEAAYTKADPSETEKDVAEAYEAAVEKWLLTRDEDKDIDKPSNWALFSRLGNHPTPGNWNDEEENQNQIVLLLRGELLQKFSNTLIYLAGRQAAIPTKPNLGPKASRIFPIFEGALPPDVVFLGFPITEADMEQYFVIFEERLQDLRFGLDIKASGSGENDFSWEHFPVSEGEYLDGLQPTIFQSNWNSAAYIAKVMVQKQVRVAVELSTLVPLPAAESEKSKPVSR